MNANRVCDGETNCIDGSDEKHCTCLKEEFKCQYSKECIDVRQLCNNVKDCVDGSDELTCCKF